jgi:hypothetical protein
MAATWRTGNIMRWRPERTGIDAAPETPVDSIAFGQPGTLLENLLFISSNTRPGDIPNTLVGGELVMVDLVTRQRVSAAQAVLEGTSCRPRPRAECF